jgi:hypothetical protein
MKANGGILDEVIFAVKTDIQEDINWLDDLIINRPGMYTKFVSEGEYEEGAIYNGSWEPCESEHIYVKIDDDVVSFSLEPTTFAEI